MSGTAAARHNKNTIGQSIDFEGKNNVRQASMQVGRKAPRIRYAGHQMTDENRRTFADTLPKIRNSSLIVEDIEDRKGHNQVNSSQ